jgi:hypothetical protein
MSLVGIKSLLEEVKAVNVAISRLTRIREGRCGLLALLGDNRRIIQRYIESLAVNGVPQIYIFRYQREIIGRLTAYSVCEAIVKFDRNAASQFGGMCDGMLLSLDTLIEKELGHDDTDITGNKITLESLVAKLIPWMLDMKNDHGILEFDTIPSIDDVKAAPKTGKASLTIEPGKVSDVKAVLETGLASEIAKINTIIASYEATNLKENVKKMLDRTLIQRYLKSKVDSKKPLKAFVLCSNYTLIKCCTAHDNYDAVLQFERAALAAKREIIFNVDRSINRAVNEFTDSFAFITFEKLVETMVENLFNDEQIYIEEVPLEL